MKNLMKLILVATLILVSCSKDDTTTDYNCGVVLAKNGENYNVACAGNGDENFQILVRYDDGITNGVCVYEYIYNDLTVGGRFCDTVFTNNN